MSHLQTLLNTWPKRVASTPAGDMSYRLSGAIGASHTLVLLHGIGSASGSWLKQLAAAQQSPDVCVIAWDAPGYAQSAPVGQDRPNATEYANRLLMLLQSLKIYSKITLVGHSLGTIVASRFALLSAERVKQLILLAPVQGFANATQEVREKSLNQRLDALKLLGPAGMAQKRSSAMLTPDVSPDLMAYVQELMSTVIPSGYTQAAYLLAYSDLAIDLPQLSAPITIASGLLDLITPAQDCQYLAKLVGVDWVNLGNVGHACPLQAEGRVNGLLGLN